MVIECVLDLRTQGEIHFPKMGGLRSSTQSGEAF